MEIKENFVTFLWIERGICKSDICENDIKRYVKVLGSDDKAQLTIMDEYDECVEVFSLSDGFNWYLVSECLDEIDSETAGFELHIQKSSTSEIMTVYSWKAFFEYIENLNLFELLNWIWKLIERCGKMVLYVPLGEELYVETKSMMVSSKMEHVDYKEKISAQERDKIVKKVRENVYVKDDRLISLIPEDFEIIESRGNNEFTSLLNHLQLVLCIAFLSNYTEIKEYSVRYDMRGYKLVDGEYCIRDAKDVSQTSGVLYKIVQWVYVDDFNVIDKCNIVRNILSLYIRKSWLEIGQEAYMAIISSYKVYLKSSVDNYLQIKNEVVDKITDISEKIVLVAESISTRVRNNLLALASFFITTLVVNTISTEKIENIFTKDITVLSYVFMIISFGYLLLCNWEMKKQKEKIQKIYESSKRLYQDVLCEEDIRNIYCGDTIYNEGTKLADDMMKKYNIFWIVSMCIVGIGIWILYMAQLR